MISIKIEATNTFLKKEDNECTVNSVSIIDSECNSDSTAYEFIDIFVRAMLGHTFSKEVILDSMQEYVSCNTYSEEEVDFKKDK